MSTFSVVGCLLESVQTMSLKVNMIVMLSVDVDTFILVSACVLGRFQGKESVEREKKGEKKKFI